MALLAAAATAPALYGIVRSGTSAGHGAGLVWPCLALALWLATARSAQGRWKPESPCTGDELEGDADRTGVLAPADAVPPLSRVRRRSSIPDGTLDLNDRVRWLYPLLRRTLPDCIDLELSLAPDLRPVRGDPCLADSALLNIVLNARQAMPGGGRLAITTANARALADLPAQAQGWVMLSIEDNGCGIDPAIRDRLFAPLVSPSWSREEAGLGLSLARCFTGRAGGRVEVRAAPGEGSVYRLYCPAADCDPAEVG